MTNEELSFSKNILLIEDSEPDSVLTQQIVSRAFPAVKIQPAKSMRQAYQICKEHSFDLVLLDLNLPDAYGPASVRELRQFMKKIPIVVLTGLGSALTISEAKKYGADTVILKNKMLDESFKGFLEPYLT